MTLPDSTDTLLDTPDGRGPGTATGPGTEGAGILSAPDSLTWRLDLSDGGVCWCYCLPTGTRYASAGADDYLMTLYQPSDGRISCLLKGETREGKGTKLNLLPACKRLMNSEIKKRKAGE